MTGIIIDTQLRLPHDVRCGRLPAWDEGDLNYPLMGGMEAGEAPEERMWQLWGSLTLDQLATPRCVGFSTAHSLAAAPKLHEVGENIAGLIYSIAQDMDEWPGNYYDGTSVRGGIKAAVHLGLAKEPYRWARSEYEVNLWIRKHGTIVAGTDWPVGFLNTDENGYLNLVGGSVGGHAYLLVGYDKERDAYRVVNSWGKEWGQGGRAWLRRGDFRILFEEMGGEAVSFTET